MTIKTKNLERQDVNSAALNPIEMRNDLVRARQLLREINEVFGEDFSETVVLQSIREEIDSWE